jgi:hypothetical protein
MLGDSSVGSSDGSWPRRSQVRTLLPQPQHNQEVAYATAPSREDVLALHRGLTAHLPVDWDDPQSVKAFKNALDRYGKSYGRLDWDDQGWVSEQISLNL